ncbi:MAG: hypothetical protein J2P28_25590 [Actinobacteria bacterium]|nr:hypothetical protein [Actinomycetota bacterium]
MRTVAGVVVASFASLLFNGAIVLQTPETRAVSSEHGLRPSLAGSLLQRRRWLVGGGLQAIGIVLQTVALLLAPVTAVQPAEAVGLVLLLFLASRMLHERIGRLEIIAVCLIIVGVGGLTVVAPHRKVTDFDAPDVWLAVAGLAIVSFMPYALRSRLGAASRVTVLGAGMSFALTAFCMKLLADAFDTRAWGLVPIVVVIAALSGFTGALSEQSALQQRQATQVAAWIFVIELLVPIILAVTVIGESWSRSPAIIAVCLLLTIAGTAILGRTPTIAQLAAAREPGAIG